MEKSQRDVWVSSGGDIGQLAVTPKSGGPDQRNRAGKVPGFDARQRVGVPGRGNQAAAWAGPDSTRITKKAETRGDVHSLRTSGGADENSAVQANADLGGSPALKARRSRPRLNKKNASPIRQAPRIPGEPSRPAVESEPMASAMREEIKKYAEDPQE